MKRTILSLVLTLVLILGAGLALDLPVSAATGGTTGSCTWQISGTTLIISGNGPMADYSDTNLPPWLESAPSITAIDVREGVTSIGSYAFIYCTQATSVLLPNYSLARIGDGAFLMCQNISSFWMPHTVTQLGMAIFGGCNRMDSLSVSTSNPVYTSAGNCIIEKATGTLVLGCTRSFIPQDAGIRAIGEGAFMMVSALGMADCTVPEGVTTIGEGAFAYAAVSHLPLPSTLKSIGVGAFLGTEVPFLEFPEGLEEIPAYCCSESTPQAVKLPSTLESIGEGAFSYCEKLKYLTLPQNLKTIDADAFWACDIRETITIPNSVQTIGSSAFGANLRLPGFEVAADHPYFKVAGNCLIEKSSGNLIAGCSSSIIPTDAGIRSIGDYAFAYTNIQNVQIPEGVTDIGDGAFCGCESLNYVRFDGASVNVGDYAFADCLTISELALQKNPPTFQSTTFENTTVSTVWVEGATQQELNSSVLPAFASATWHYADNACDSSCNVCTATRSGTVTAHRYTNECDPDCNRCSQQRDVEGHTYNNACDPSCNKCNETRPVPDHVYDNDCDTACNVCGATRQTSHKYDDACDEVCNVCSETRKAPHVYDDRNDLICNECDYERPPYIPGDVDENDKVDLDDAIYLLYHVNFSSIYPVEQPVDFDGSGTVDLDDAIYLLYHVNFPDTYPLKEKVAWLWPLPAETPGTVTQKFSQDHLGIDIEVGGWENNGKISALAAADGHVVRADYYSDWGNLVVVDHENGFSTYYAHLDSIAVSVGDVVSQGDVLGKIGATGSTSTVKLYFLMYAPAYEGGPSVRTDPLIYVKHPG